MVRGAGADILPHAAFSATGGPGTNPCQFHLAPGFVVWSGVMRRHLPSFGRGWTTRSYSNEVSPDLSTFRTVFRDTFRSRAISLIVLPLMKCSRRIRAIVSTISIPDHLLHDKAGSATDQPVGVILDADPLA